MKYYYRDAEGDIWFWESKKWFLWKPEDSLWELITESFVIDRFIYGGDGCGLPKAKLIKREDAFLEIL